MLKMEHHRASKLAFLRHRRIVQPYLQGYFDMRMKLTGKSLDKFEAQRDTWQEVLDGGREIKTC